MKGSAVFVWFHPPMQCYGCCRHGSAVRAVPVLPTLLCMQAMRRSVNLSAGGLVWWSGGKGYCRFGV
jgi:hypothetical protein